jgi:hypothetical protein
MSRTFTFLVALVVVTIASLSVGYGSARGGGSLDGWSFWLGGLVGIIALYALEIDAWPWRR